LAIDHDARVLVLCGPSEREAALSIARLADHPRARALADQPGPLGIGLSKALVRRASLMVTTDSGPRHFATAFRVPVVSLFGPTHIGWTRTNHPHALNLRVPVPCGPCQRGTCPEGHHRCMVELGPEAVLRASASLLPGAVRRDQSRPPMALLSGPERTKPLSRSAPTCPPGS
jgi:heptosyltransferase-2